MYSSLWGWVVLPLASGILSIVVCSFATVLLVVNRPFPYISQIGIVCGETSCIGVELLVGVDALHIAERLGLVLCLLAS